MKITVKQLKGGECTLEVSPSTSIHEIKRGVAEWLKIPIDEQKLLLAGRTLSDEQTVESYPSIKDGTKLNLVVMKPEGLIEAGVKYFRSMGKSEADSLAMAHELKRLVREKVYRMSWDDLDRLCYDILLEDGILPRPPAEQIESEPECDSFTL